MTGQNESTYSLNRKAIRAPLCSTQPLWIILTETPPDSFRAYSFLPVEWLMHEPCHLYVNENRHYLCKQRRCGQVRVFSWMTEESVTALIPAIWSPSCQIFFGSSYIEYATLVLLDPSVILPEFSSEVWLNPQRASLWNELKRLLISCQFSVNRANSQPKLPRSSPLRRRDLITCLQLSAN